MTAEPTPKPEASASQKLAYNAPSSGGEGALRELPEKLSQVVVFDQLELEGIPNSKRLKLWFRHGAKRIFHVSLFRRSGRYVIEVGGLNPGHVLKGIAICRDHFDRWFGIDARDISLYELKRRRPSSAGRRRT